MTSLGGVGEGYRRETSSATISAAGSRCFAEPDALSGPQRQRLDLTCGSDQRGRRGVADDRFTRREVRDHLPFSRSATGWRLARLLPPLSGRVVERAVRRVRPPHLIEVGVPLCVGLAGVDQQARVFLVDRHLLGQQKAGPEPGGLCAEGEHGRDAAGVSDPTRRDHGYRRHRVHHRRHQWERRHAAPHVPPGLPALGDDDVCSTPRRPAWPPPSSRPCASPALRPGAPPRRSSRDPPTGTTRSSGRQRGPGRRDGAGLR